MRYEIACAAMDVDYISTREAAEILGDRLRALYERIDAGELRAWSFTNDAGMAVIRLK